MEVFEKLDSFDESKASLSTWIYAIAHNTLTDYFSTRKVFSEIPETIEDNFPVEDDRQNQEAMEILTKALEVPNAREQVIILCYYSGKTLREITMQMGISCAYGKVL